MEFEIAKSSFDLASRILNELQEGDLLTKKRAIQKAGFYVSDRFFFPEAFSLILDFLNQTEAFELSLEAASVLWKFRDPRATEPLLKKYKETTSLLLKEKIIRSLGLLEASEALHLFFQLSSLDSQVSIVEREAALFSLSFFKLAKGKERIVENLGFPHPMIRKEALQSLNRFWKRNSIAKEKALFKKIRKQALLDFEEAAVVRAEALTFLAENDLSTKNFIWRSAKKDPSVSVRARACLLLGHWMDEGIEKFYLELLQDLHWSLRYAACEALANAALQGKIWNRTLVSSVLEHIPKTFPSRIYARRRAIQALIQLKNRSDVTSE